MSQQMDIGREPKRSQIAGQWFVDLDQYVDTERFERLHERMCEGIARSWHLSEPVVIGSKESQYDMTLSEVEFAKSEHPEDETLKRLLSYQHREAAYQYVRFRYPTMALGRKILLRTYVDYHNGFARKHLARLNHDMPAYSYFPELKQFISDLPIFSEVGRVIIFLTDGNAKAEIHCDYADGKSRKDQFLWLNPRRAKRFFVLDTEFNKRYLTGIANTFDNASWHGGDPSPYATFTVRIDGRFSQKFLDASNLAEHYERPRKQVIEPAEAGRDLGVQLARHSAA